MILPAVLLVLAIAIVVLAITSVIDLAFGLLALPLLLLFGWLAVGKEGLERQKKIQQLKRFRRDAKGRRIALDEEDRKTIAL